MTDTRLLTEAELAITEAIVAVEKAGASAALTRASILLSHARKLIADHVEGRGDKPETYSHWDMEDDHLE